MSSRPDYQKKSGNCHSCGGNDSAAGGATEAELLRRTDNGPSEPDEEELLRAEFGEPDADGVYGVSAPDGGEEA